MTSVLLLLELTEDWLVDDKLLLDELVKRLVLDDDWLEQLLELLESTPTVLLLDLLLDELKLLSLELELDSEELDWLEPLELDQL